MEHGNQNVAASNARFRRPSRASQKETQDTFDNYLHSVQHNSLLTDRTNADFDEVIHGYRTIEDTQTGDRAYDLGNVNEIVNSLNEHDPGRYIQIPLRDEGVPAEPRTMMEKPECRRSRLALEGTSQKPEYSNGNSLCFSHSDFGH